MKPLVLKDKIGLKGFYNFYKRTPEGDIPLLGGAVSDNLIVDAGINAYKSHTNPDIHPINSTIGSTGQSYQLFRVFKVGTGAAEPTVSDLDLQSVLASVADNNNSAVENLYNYDVVTDTFTYTHSKQLAFPIGGVVGNISEVGVFGNGSSGVASAATVLFSRALIKDINGDPTTITLTADDQLVIKYTLVLIAPRTITYNFNHNSVDYTLEGKCFGSNPTIQTGFRRTIASNASNILFSRSTDFTYPEATDLNFPTSGWAQLSGAQASSQVTALNPASVRKVRYRLPLASSNYAGGIKGLAFNSSGAWVFKFTPAFPKTANEILEIEFATDFVRL